MNVKAEAIAEANAHLNNVGLPNVHAMASALKHLAQQARLSDLPENNRAIEAADHIVASYEGGITGANL